MSQVALTPQPPFQRRPTPPLQSGDRLSRPEFERRFDATPGLKKAELINGIVYMPPPVSFDEHASPHFDLITLIGLYRMSTPGVLGGDNGPVRLGSDSMPQPDVCLFIDPMLDGRSRMSADGYLEGAPEFVCEVAASSANIDLHMKLDLYRRHGAPEYVVWRTYDEQIDYFIHTNGEYVLLTPEPSGEFRSRVFPGLWLDAPAILRRDWQTAMATVQRGIASPEHAAFVATLAARAVPPSPNP